MSNRKVASRYASSLLESSLQKGTIEKVAKDIELVTRTFESNSQLKKVLENPVIKANIKKSILQEVFKGNISKEAEDFLIFSIEKGRENMLFEILQRFLVLRDDQLNIINVEVRTAYEFTPEQEKELRNRLETSMNKTIRLKFYIDKDIIGGYVAKVGDTVYNASLKHQLELLKKQFLHGSASLN